MRFLTLFAATGLLSMVDASPGAESEKVCGMTRNLRGTVVNRVTNR